MKYLKLFESFGDDFKKSLNDLQDKYESDKEQLFKRCKDRVDQFMFDLTDDYSNQSTYQNDFIEDDDPRVSIWYFLKCEWKDFEKFLNLLQETDERLQSELGLKVMLTSRIKGKFEGYHELHHGFSISVSKTIEIYNNYYSGERRLNSKESPKLEDYYTHVEFKINVRP
jgi:hypothetical protein